METLDLSTLDEDELARLPFYKNDGKWYIVDGNHKLIPSEHYWGSRPIN